jgi:hypothetical protein
MESLIRSNFVDNSFGMNFTEVLSYTTTIDGHDASTVVTAPGRYVREGESHRYPDGTTVRVADLKLVRKGGRWYITEIALCAY